jgi:hypothetical protein
MLYLLYFRSCYIVDLHYPVDTRKFTLFSGCELEARYPGKFVRQSLFRCSSCNNFNNSNYKVMSGNVCSSQKKAQLVLQIIHLDACYC